MLAAIGAAAGALSLTATQGSEPRDSVTHNVLPIFVPSGDAGGVDMGVVSIQFVGDEGARAVGDLGVFTRHGRISDVPPSSAQPILRLMARTGLGVEPERGRLLVTRPILIYGVPSASGLCYFVTRLRNGVRHSVGCAGPLVDGATLVVNARQDVWGVAEDRARTVDVVLAHGVLHAAIRRNAFYVRLPPGVVVPKAVVVHAPHVRHVFEIKPCKIDDVTPLGVAPLGPVC